MKIDFEETHKYTLVQEMETLHRVTEINTMN